MLNCEIYFGLQTSDITLLQFVNTEGENTINEMSNYGLYCRQYFIKTNRF